MALLSARLLVTLLIPLFSVYLHSANALARDTRSSAHHHRRHGRRHRLGLLGNLTVNGTGNSSAGDNSTGGRTNGTDDILDEVDDLLDEVDEAPVNAPVGAPELQSERPWLSNSDLVPHEEMYTHWQKVGQATQPYDALIGARLFDILDEVPTMTPPPSQDFISQTFVAQCPLVMFSDALYIRPPTCNDPTGSWVDPATDRVVLRWRANGDGSLTFGVDSTTSGAGGVTYASMQEELRLGIPTFKLLNCLGVLRWTMEEDVTQVTAMGPGDSTAGTFDASSGTGTAFFLRYTLTEANGTTRSMSNLFRMGSNRLTYHQPLTEGALGPEMAQVVRHGGWTGEDWKKCDGVQRQWQVTFTETQRTYTEVATVMDPRVAIATMVTMMALRDETRSAASGFTSWQRWSHLGALLWSWLIFSVVILLLTLLIVIGKDSDRANQLQRYLFRVEAVLLPRKPATQRILPPHYGAY